MRFRLFKLLPLVFIALWFILTGAIWALTNATQKTIFLIGTPDESALEFGLADNGWQNYKNAYPKPVIFTVGKSQLSEFPYIHPSRDDSWAGSNPQTFTIKFNLTDSISQNQNLIIGLADSHPTSSDVAVKVNEQTIGISKAPPGLGSGANPRNQGKPNSMLFRIPAEVFKVGENTLSITLSNGSWIVYDYVYLGEAQSPPQIVEDTSRLQERLLEQVKSACDEIVFAVRKPGSDGHWYANIGYYADCELEYKVGNIANMHHGKRVTYRFGGKLGKLNLKTGSVSWLIDDPQGSVRDPAVHYNGKTILFSWRKGDSEHFHLYTINADGSGLKQLTDGDYDDFEPAWLSDGGIVFVSTRAKRWVNCWITQVATIHRCDSDGKNIRMLSANNEHDNTPWQLPDGRIIYQRWEYVDRSQVDYHHLWTMNPDGTSQMVFFGNQQPGTVMIDAKPIPNSSKVVAIFSPGHGIEEHQGYITVVDSSAGPDNLQMAKSITKKYNYRDPWAFSESAFMAATGAEIQLLDNRGRSFTLYRLSDNLIKEGYWIHEPRPIAPSERPALIPERVHLNNPNGRLILANVYSGRNMFGVKPGEIKKLLVLETLPKPINFTGGMDPLTYGGSFTLERVVGTVPVEPDGSAYFELPALRAFLLVALDEQDMSVKRMQSFLTVQPGETIGCIGCHEQRSSSYIPDGNLMALKKPPAKITPISDCPDVFDFPRDIQPILNKLCVDCHDYAPGKNGGPYAGKIILTGDHGPMFSHSYFTMTVKRLFSDGRNLPKSNYAPRQLGSSASKILKMLDGSHYSVRASEYEKKIIRLWIETGAPYPGTYAALGSGSIGGYQENTQINTDFNWETTKAGADVINRRCASCHNGEKTLPRAISDEIGISFWRFDLNDRRLQFSRHILFNLSRPDKSLILLAPLSKEAGGFGICATNSGANVFASKSDADYQKLLAMAAAGKEYLEKIKRFDMPGFKPRYGWYREMKRYGILPANFDTSAPVNFYEVEKQYFQSFWYKPLQIRAEEVSSK